MKNWEKHNRIYHGSAFLVDVPRILKPNRGMDYGSGFYCTTDIRQARRWTMAHIEEGQTGYVNEYSIDWESTNGLSVLRFLTANEEWVDFVERNRTERGFDHGFDLVIGPVADDRVNRSFSLYEQGIIDKTMLLSRLKTYRLTDQILFHSAKALECLSFVGAQEVVKPVKRRPKSVPKL